MPVLDQPRLRAALRCPACRGTLAWDPPRCLTPGCPGALGFPIVANQPALIDFANSVVDPSALRDTGGGSAIRRGARLRHKIRRLAYGENSVAAANARRLLALLPPNPTLLIIGGGEQGVGVDQLVADPHLQTIAFDIYASPLTQFVADAHAIPLADQTVDAVWIQAVLEHVLDPARVAAEIHRVLRPAGLVYAETPFMQQVHEGAYDFTRFTESGHRWLFRRFEHLGSGPVGGAGTVLIWSIRSLMTALLGNRKLAEAATLPFFWLRFLDRANTADYASGTWFLGRRAETEISPKQVIGFYSRASLATNQERASSRLRKFSFRCER